MTFLEKKQVENLFSNFEILKFDEVEKNMLTGLKEIKHWHLFFVVAKKK